MAKKKAKKTTKPTGKVKVRRPVVTEEDTGIYSKKTVVDWAESEISADEQAAILHEAGDYARQLASILEGVTRDAADVVRPYAKTNDPADRTVPSGRQLIGGIDLGDGPACYTFPAEMPDAADEAMRLLHLVREVGAGAPGEAYGLLQAIELGQLLERMYVRPHEPNALAGKRAKPGRVKGGKATRKVTAEVAELAYRLFHEIKSPNLSNDRVWQRVSTELIKQHGIEVSAGALYTNRDFILKR